MRYVWQRFRQPVPTTLCLSPQESLTALATAMIAIDDEVLPVELAKLREQLVAAGVEVSPALWAQVSRWVQEVDPLELFWAGVRGLVPHDRELAVKMVARLALADGETLIEENDLVALLGEALGFSHQEVRRLVAQATEA